ncbi:heme-binding protein 2-like [Mytilus trossulus]|uniref:heme-binding protein 2-like n=1 Tax=Mytilus trossulus TaxID=6551 RepID=UPI003007EB23
MLIKLAVVLLMAVICQGEKLFYKPRMIKVLPSNEIEPQKKPDFCNKLDCPEYKVIESSSGYELREYTATHWVSTALAGIDYSKASSEMFMKLFAYIQGKNAKKEKIAMTAPVLVRLIPGQGPACESNFTMSFFMSNKVADPPAPTDSTVTLKSAPTFRAYVRQFGGYYRKIEDWIKEAQELIKSINDPSKYHTEFYFTAGYDSPFRIFNRHNEIWFISK